MLQSPTGPSGWLKVSPLEVLITRACEPSLHEPNYALHLEVAEYINQKKANNPREAAMMIARLANHRNPHIAILSLALLDTLVQSCGYPFHLQVSTKEFLNELVRRFPERPPPFPGPVMSRILELIHGWKEGMCTESRWKEDLGNIRDMHRLLTFKGYRFRDNGRASSSTAANVTANLKTADELEEEDRAAQSAKLQELIRRGTPRDLEAAQELMKSLAGADPEAKPDYRSQSLTELNKLEQKVILLNEMLDNVDSQRGERFASGDAYDQVSSILVAASPKIQKWISDAATDDPESLDTFLQINDQINTVLARYEAFKTGNYTFASNPIPEELSGPSLIDLDESAPPTTTTTTSGAVEELASLFAQNPVQAPPQPQQQWGMPPIGYGVPQQQPQQAIGGYQQPPYAMYQSPPQQPQQQQPQQWGMPPPGYHAQSPPQQPHAPTPLFHNGAAAFARPNNSMSPPHAQSATPPASIVLPGTPGPAIAQAHIGNGQLLGKGGPVQQQQPWMASQSPQPMMQPTAAAVSQPSVPAQQQNKDPFADLAGLF
ncbi:hypothetical protein HYPSUDRAFT_40882 [Hypholoma sublateritium FD-334 SS-4]|uniref:VHS domain-containing protein n=1 Tax=Hypholoma sublateritium (strain FD-334 SS-4) TaxID=945553 RepID=A0A0D2P1B4_HYPSF|nr:hypothetical protein HYPSUDRAFT_40882 [Hypholoma sublateritium FD-334 SS-4]